MPSERSKRKDAYTAKTTQEFRTFAVQGVCMAGNAFASVLLVKGQEDFEEAELSALKASLEHLGYAPEAWATLLTTTKTGDPINPLLVRQAISAFSPDTVLMVNDAAVASVRKAYANELAQLKTDAEKTFSPRVLVHVCGMRMVNLDNFAGALEDPRQKQLRWAAIKQVPPLGEPY
jgi:hypothetical protein